MEMEGIKITRKLEEIWRKFGFGDARGAGVVALEPKGLI